MRSAWTGALLLGMVAVAAAQDQQLGARTKAMGGSYTAFEDDPVSIWLNPAAISTQPSALAVSYQTYTTYSLHREQAAFGDPSSFSAEAETKLVEPALLPAYVGFVFHVGAPDSGMAVGLCYARPYHLNYSFNRIDDPLQLGTEVPNSNLDQGFNRFRVAFAKDWRIKAENEPGFFTHLSAGFGLDAGYVHREFTSDIAELEDTALAFGGGAGLLLGLYDNTESFRVNVGVAWQSAVKPDFDVDPDIVPGFDMPQQVNAGVTFYLLEGYYLRLTVDAQWVEWSDTAVVPLFSGQNSFEDAVNFSFGVEYRFDIAKDVRLYPRAGYRRFDAPWEDENDLPMTSNYKLVVDTKGESFNLFTLGLGLAWAGTDGKQRSVDLGADFGGDTWNVALGVTYEF